jgi:outer membrane protein assembly factor BamB
MNRYPSLPAAVRFLLAGVRVCISAQVLGRANAYTGALLLAAFVQALPASAQTPIWIQRAYGVGDRDAISACGTLPSAKSQKVDASGNVFVTGCASNAADNVDMVTYKVDGATGTTVWRATYAGSSAANEGGISLAIDASGNVMVAGFSADIAGAGNIRVIKYNGVSGAEIWNVAYNGSANSIDTGIAIALDAAGNAFVTGLSTDTIGSENLRTIKFNAATGAVMWTEAFSGSASTGNDQAYGVAVDPSGNVIVTGNTTDASGNNIRTIKYNGTFGTELWNVLYNGNGGATSEDGAFAIAIDASGNAFVTGVSTDAAGDQNMRTIKYSSATGAQLWTAAFNGTSGRLDLAIALALDGTGNPIITGYSKDVNGGQNMRTVKYNGATGAELWAAVYNGNASGDDFALAVAIDASGNAVITGYSADLTGQNVRTIKYNGTDGAVLWNVSYIGIGSARGDDRGSAVSIDASGNVLVSGYNTEPVVGSVMRTIKYNGASGAVIWNTTQVLLAPASAGGTPYSAKSMKVDASGNIFITGASTDLAGGTNMRTAKFSGATGAEIWSLAYTGSGIDPDGSYGLALDPAGNVIVIGDSSNVTAGTNMRTTKYDGATGAELWSVQRPGLTISSTDGGNAVAVNASGDVFVTGISNDGSGSGGQNIRTIKYSGIDGAQLWSVAYSGAGADNGIAIAVDPSGNPVITGHSIDATGGQNIRSIKYNGATGAQLWNVFFNGAGNGTDVSRAIAMDTSGNVFVTGASVDAGANRNMRTTKYNGTTGAQLWSVAFSGTNNSGDLGNSVAVDAGGNVVVTGYSNDTAGGFNVRTIKYNGTTGAEIWNAVYNGSANGADQGSAVTIDASGNVIVTGYSNETGGGFNIRTIKYNGATGAVMWSRDYGGSANGGDFGYAVATTPDGNIVIFGTSNEAGKPQGWLIQKITNGNGTGGAVNDLNGDGKSDVLLRNSSNGQIDGVLMNGYTATASATFMAPGSGWTATHTADLNGDGKADILWRHTDGRVAAWLMNGLVSTGGAIFMSAGSGWSVTHTADLNGDGKADILWRHTDGRVAVWIMEGLGATSGAILLAAPNAWSITHVADLNGDGKADILLRNTDGTVAVWLMNGTTITAGATLLAAPNAWSITHTADLNADGKADILWRNTDGTVAAWLMNGTSLADSNTFMAAGSGWSITHMVDLNGDGKADILWRNTDGSTATWIMNGLGSTGGASLIPAPNSWTVTYTGDLNGDGKTDLIWRHPDGRLAIWLMNGAAQTAGGLLAGPGALEIVP